MRALGLLAAIVGLGCAGKTTYEPHPGCFAAVIFDHGCYKQVQLSGDIAACQLVLDAGAGAMQTCEDICGIQPCSFDAPTKVLSCGVCN